MNISQLRYFLKTAELLNYTRAAEELFITRQSLRQAITSMEAELGVSLFTTTHNHLSLTGEGDYLRISAAKVIGAYDAMISGIQRLNSSPISIRIAFSCSLFPFILPDISVMLDRIRERLSGIHLDTIVLSNDEAISAVERGEADISCILQMPRDRHGIASYRLDSFAVCVDYNRAHPLRQSPVISLEQLCAYPCIGMGSLENTLYPMEQACRAQRLTPQYRVIPDALDAFYMIQHGEAIGLDLDLHGMPGFEQTCSSSLPGFEWELCLLYPNAHSEQTALEWICQSFSQVYSRQNFTR